jgi:hypothetical protein
LLLSGPGPEALRGPPPITRAVPSARSPLTSSGGAAVRDPDPHRDRLRHARGIEHIDPRRGSGLGGLAATAAPLAHHGLEARAALRVQRRGDAALQVLARLAHGGAALLVGEAGLAGGPRLAQDPVDGRDLLRGRLHLGDDAFAQSARGRPRGARSMNGLAPGRRRGHARSVRLGAGGSGARNGPEAERRVRDPQGVRAVVGDDLEVRGHARQQRRVVVVDADDRRVGHHVLHVWAPRRTRRTVPLKVRFG